jgi:hypothetical protein
MPKQTVVNGQVTLPTAATFIVVGLAYESRLRTLPLDYEGAPTIQGKRKRIPAVTMRLMDTRGLYYGFDDATMVPIKERKSQSTLIDAPLAPSPQNDYYMQQTLGLPIQLVSGDERVIMPPNVDMYAQISFEQYDPLPATVLGVIPEAVIGDTVNR